MAENMPPSPSAAAHADAGPAPERASEPAPTPEPATDPLTVVVIGAGGIGGWLGARLAQAGDAVGFLVHGVTLAALRSEGLTLTGSDGATLAHLERPVASDDAARLVDALGRRPDVVLVTTKADAVAGLRESLRALTGPGTGVVSTQNGLDAPRVLADAVGPGHVLPGVARVYARVLTRGHVQLTGDLAALQVREWDDSLSERASRLLAHLSAAGVRAGAPESIWAELWRKVAFVVPQGALGAVLDVPLGELRTTHREAYRAMVQEVVDVAAAQGYALAAPGEPAYVETVLAFADAQPAEATTSMQRDIAAGLPSELDAQVGAVRRAARELGVPTPLFGLAEALLSPREALARA